MLHRIEDKSFSATLAKIK